jgi:hypothetical protein
MSATLTCLGFEVNKGCTAAVTAATVGGASRSLSFNTAGASGVLNITGLAVDFYSIAGTQVCRAAGDLEPRPTSPGSGTTPLFSLRSSWPCRRHPLP